MIPQRSASLGRTRRDVSGTGGVTGGWAEQRPRPQRRTTGGNGDPVLTVMKSL